MDTYTAVIVDDETEARELLSALIADHIPEVKVVATAGSADQAIELILAGDPDIVFLDIDMPGKNGFEVAHTISRHNLLKTIIFVTAFNQFAIDAIRCAAFDYLLKPVSINDLKATINRLKGTKKAETLRESLDKLINCLNKEKIGLKYRTGIVYVNPEEIVYCEADGNYTNIYLADGTSQTTSMTLGILEAKVEGMGFSKISRSVLVNRRYITSTDRKSKKCVLQANGTEYKLDIKGKYSKYWI